MDAKVSYRVKRSLSSIPDGEVFNYRRFASQIESEQAIVQALSRLSKKGEIVRLGKGQYYKPRKTRFGTLRPSESEIVNTFTRKGDSQVGYLTGLALYNQLGLTTQVSNTLVIARTSRLPEKEVNGYKIKFVTRPIKFTEQDIPLLQLLDAIRDIRDIPDTTVDQSIVVLVARLISLSSDKLKRLIKLALEYNPATKALTGAILEYYFDTVDVTVLAKSLNPLSKYKIGVASSVLPNASNWNVE
ncbi:MAG: hypothetical protein EOO08_12150 [Chitinophagaceae bacterium]|nr:MAG: hypothetical protein EOO08_12150 [Chitinophagaceae bacterium]